MDKFKPIIIDELLNIATKNNIYVHKMDMKVTTPDVSSPNDATIIMNTNFQTNTTYSYRLAHEISHILYGDHDAQAVYQFSEYGKRGEELLAHRNAINMLMTIEMPRNPLLFMDYYRVPSWLESDVVRIFESLR
ncbi:ImmA/IrrE family metallo-endopeptidase [Periweissella fabaria]|uniref:IrrE N-terminal-like domain-containing protein n=1 Tax=Periweissella fabaria TaxID=546157 RepID=A0ABM8Z3S9_9LACO|nr:ImmA/IrrE family metallo-endopeptidase [Periweissella fabaria]MCM0596314.1 ImmA/IrrE family metallo-endopeptidase [Periweissella fabaria]CAH0415930.1 hypothetical protein WFA24289_00228 [Periweissella fabaria]